MSSATIRAIIWLAVAFVLVIALLLTLDSNALGLNLNFGFSTYSYADSEEYTPASTGHVTLGDPIDKVAIHWVSGDIHVRFYDGETISISETAGRALEDHEKLYYRVKGGKLTIQYCEARRGLQFTNMPSKSLEVLLPASVFYDALDIENISSSLTVEGTASIRSLDIENVSGSITLSGLTASALDLQTVNGGLNASGTYNIIDVESVSGSLAFRLYALPAGVDVETVSGSVDLALPENTGFSAKLDSVSGSLKSNFADATKRQLTYLSAKPLFSFETVSGSVQINRDTSLSSQAQKPEKESKATKAPEASPSPSPSSNSVPSAGRSF